MIIQRIQVFNILQFCRKRVKEFLNLNSYYSIRGTIIYCWRKYVSKREREKKRKPMVVILSRYKYIYKTILFTERAVRVGI